MILEDLHKTLLTLLKDGELPKYKFHRKAGAESGEIKIAIKELEEAGLVKSHKPWRFGKGQWPTIFNITDAGREELAKFK